MIKPGRNFAHAMTVVLLFCKLVIWFHNHSHNLSRLIFTIFHLWAHISFVTCPMFVWSSIHVIPMDPVMCCGRTRDMSVKDNSQYGDHIILFLFPLELANIKHTETTMLMTRTMQYSKNYNWGSIEVYNSSVENIYVEIYRLCGVLFSEAN